MRDSKQVKKNTNAELSDSDEEFTKQSGELFGKCFQLFQEYQNKELAKQELTREQNLVGEAAGDRLVAKLCATWAASQDSQQPDRFLTMFRSLQSQMSEHYYSPDEYYRAIEFCKSPTFADEMSLIRKRINNPNDPTLNQADLLLREKLIDRFAKSCPINSEKLIEFARTVEKEDYQCFINPSKTITNHWNNDIKWYRFCYAALELSSKEPHKDALALYRWFGYVRFKIAVLLKHKRENVVFGLLRLETLCGLGSGFCTSITNVPESQYHDQFSFCSNALKSFENIENNDCIKHIFVDVGSEKNKKIVKVTIILDPVTKAALSKIYRTQFMGFECIVISHPPAIHIDTIYNKCIQPLYEQIWASDDQHLIYRNIGKIVWYELQLMPCEGGSAAVTLMNLYDILNKKKLPLTQLQGDISLDFRAIFEPDIDKFTANLRSLLTLGQVANKVNLRS